MEINWPLVLQSLPLLLEGTKLTIRITAMAVVTGCIIGVFVGMARISKNRLVNTPATLYVEFIRGTPLMVQLVFIHYGLPQVTGVNLPPFLSAFIAFGVNSGAYISEIVRGGIQSIARGQMEAARSLGMSYHQAMGYIILPQALRRILPPLGNEFVILIKESALISVLGVGELLRTSHYIVARTFEPFLIYFMTACIYLVLTTTFSQLVRYMERRLAVGD